MSGRSLPWFIQEPAKALEVYKNPSNVVFLDYETTNINRGSALEEDNEIVLACWYVVTPDGVSAKHCWGNQFEQEELEQDIRASQFIVAHNAKFELGWLRRSGIDLRDVLVFDTMLAEWVLGGNRWQLQDLSLAKTAARYGLGEKEDVASYLIGKGICPSEIPQEWLLPYCYRDVELSYQIYQEQIELLVNEGLLHLALTRNLSCAALADMEFAPQQLDHASVTSLYNDSIAEFQELEQAIADMAGDINIGSTKQLIVYLYDVLGFAPPIDKRSKEPIVTPGGQLATDQATLALLVAGTKEQEKFLTLYKRMNSLGNLLSKNLEFFHAVVDEKDGEFYGRFNQGNTQTHRLSSSGVQMVLKAFKKPKAPQLQNLPRALKYLFTTYDDDELVVEVDGSQLEYRVAVDLGKDKIGYREICEGVDVHQVTADVLTEAGQPTTRQEAKSRTFIPLFGGGGQTKPERDYVQFFRDKYEGVTETQKGWALTTVSKKWYRTPYGMKFYFPGTKIDRNGYITNSTSIYNYPIQGFATGEIIPIALTYLWHRTADMPITLFNTIHDSVAARVKQGVLGEYEAVAKQCFTYDVYEYLRSVYKYAFRVPLGVGIKASKLWAAGKDEVGYDVWPDGRERRTHKAADGSKTTTYKEADNGNS